MRNAARLNSLFGHRGRERGALRTRKAGTADCGEAGRIPHAERRAAGLRYSITATAAAKPPVCVMEIMTLCAPSA